MNNQPLLIVGASARAAQHSACRAGLDAIGIDLFHDVDSCSHGEPVSTEHFPESLIERTASLPQHGWLYTGGLENAPKVVEAISEKHRLLGNNSATLRRIRDPLKIDASLRAAGFPSAWSFAAEDELDFQQGILLKPARSGGGQGVELAILPLESTNAHEQQLQLKRRVKQWRKQQGHVQQFLRGELIGACYLSDASDCHFLGATLQYAGESRLHAPAFAYCGSAGPVDCTSLVREQLIRLGRVMRSEFNLKGLFGIDAIVRREEVWLLEINPRYTASLEVLELANGAAWLTEHIGCFQDLTATPRKPNPASSRLATTERMNESKHGRVTKVITYVPDADSLRVTRRFVERALSQNEQGKDVRIADIPRPNTLLLPGQPAFTVLLSHPASDPADFRNALQTAASQADQWLAHLQSANK